jgi:hypothetical protein
MTLYELTEVLVKTKKKKDNTPGEDNIKSEMLQY